MKTRVITASENRVLEYLKSRKGEFVSPSEIGDALHPMSYPGIAPLIGLLQGST